MIAVVDEQAIAHARRGWDGTFAAEFGIELLRVDQPFQRVEELRAVQVRQRRVSNRPDSIEASHIGLEVHAEILAILGPSEAVAQTSCVFVGRSNEMTIFTRAELEVPCDRVTPNELVKLAKLLETAKLKGASARDAFQQRRYDDAAKLDEEIHDLIGEANDIVAAARGRDNFR